MKQFGLWGGLIVLSCAIFLGGCDQLEKKPSPQPVIPPTPEIKSTIVEVKGLEAGKPIKKISLGFNHSCVLYDDGTVGCWGGNEFGQLGCVSEKVEDCTLKRGTPRFAPQTIKTALVFEDIEAGEMVTCGITKAENLYCWGKNTYGQLGLDGMDKGNAIAVPTQIMRTKTTTVKNAENKDETKSEKIPLAGVLKVYSNYSTMCALTAKEALCWGNTIYAHLVDDKEGKKIRKTDVMSKQTEPTPVNPVTKAQSEGFGDEWLGTTTPTQLVLLENDICGVVDNQLRCLKSLSTLSSNIESIDGKNENHLYFTQKDSEGVWYVRADGHEPVGTPSNDSALQDVVAFAAGKYHQCVLRQTEGKADEIGKEVLCMGGNSAGQLGFTPSQSEQLEPQPIKAEGFDVAKLMATGAYHSCAATPENRLFCWGANDQGQCGVEAVKRKKAEVKW